VSSGGGVFVVGGCAFVSQSGGSFDCDGGTFDDCGAFGGNGYGGGLYILNKGGNSKIRGSEHSFSNCKANNATKILIEADNLETALEERISIDFVYDTSDNDDVVGMLINNMFSLTPLRLYDCLIKSKMKQNVIDTCSILPTCSLSCPTNTNTAICIIIMNKIFYFFCLF
jgi:hypothetical protein